jgi:hypothetical protein
MIKSAGIAGLVFLAACGGGGDNATAPSAPKPGQLAVEVTGTASDDAAALLKVYGPGPITAPVSAREGVRIETLQVADTIKVAVFADNLGGDLVRLSVPDVQRAADYTVEVLDVASTANHLRTDVSGYHGTVH